MENGALTFPPTREANVHAAMQALVQDPDDAYWSRRLLEVASDPPEGALRDALTRAFVTWASHDPAWFASEGAVSMAVHAWGWPYEMLEQIEERIAIEDSSLRHLVLGRLFHAARVGRDEKERRKVARRAAHHLARVKDPFRVSKLLAELADALSYTDPAALLAGGDDLLAGTSGPFDFAGVLVSLLEAAAATDDWAAYDRYRRVYQQVQDGKATRRGVGPAVLNLDGLRALALKKPLRPILEALIECAPNHAFLGNASTMRLVEKLVARRVELALCEKYLAAIEESDGREWVVPEIRKLRDRARASAARRSSGRAPEKKKTKKSRRR
jgi:hypothetical protein